MGKAPTNHARYFSCWRDWSSNAHEDIDVSEDHGISVFVTIEDVSNCDVVADIHKRAPEPASRKRDRDRGRNLRLKLLNVDALLTHLDGKPTAGAVDGKRVAFVARDYLGSSDWVVATEQATLDGNRVDLFLTNDERKVAIVIENKLDAAVYNPFESYARHAMRSYPTSLVVVLAPSPRTATVSGAPIDQWTSASLAYDDIFDSVMPTLSAAPTQVDPRSMDLLEQFVENTSAKGDTVDTAEESKILEEFWSAVRGREDSFVEFFRVLDEVNSILKGRAERLRSVILERFEARGIEVDESFVVAGNDHGWGRRNGLVAVVYLGFHLAAGPGVELVLGFFPERRAYEFTIKAYADRRKPNNCIPGYDHIALAAGYADNDWDIALKFIEVVERVQSLRAR
jgi:hypothetical protein